MTKITSILFDLDGTLIDSINAHINVIISIAKKHGVSFNKEEFSHVNGMSSRAGFKKIMKEKHVKFKGFKLIEIVFDRLRKEKEIEEAITIYPQTKKMLEEMKKEGYQLAVATSSNKKYLNLFLKKFSIKKYFSANSTINDVRQGKPNPDIFLKSAEKLNVKAEECVVVEDSVNGVIAGKRAGMKVIAVLNTTKKSLFVGEAKPDVFINNIGEINKKLISKL